MSGQRELLVSYLGTLRFKDMSEAETIMLAQLVAKEFTNTDPEDPWDPDTVTEMVRETRASWDAGPSAVVPAGFVERMREREVPAHVQSRVADEMARRQALELVEAWELEEARGPRVKRTAAEFARLPKVPTIMDQVLAAEVNLLGGPSAAGKSLLARDWSLCVAAGAPWRSFQVPKARNVLWVASEGLHDFAERWESQPLWDEARDRVYVLDETVDLVHGQADVDWIVKEYAREQPGLVIFDVVYGMGMADDNGVKDVIPLMASMKKLSAALGCATLALGHPTHETSLRRFRGSGSWRQLAAVEWHMCDDMITCEKSKIADARRLHYRYGLAYPNITFPTTGEVVASDSERFKLIREDFSRHPDDSQRQRAERLAPILGLSSERARKLVKAVNDTLKTETQLNGEATGAAEVSSTESD